MGFLTESLDFDVHAGGQIELHERVYRLRRWLQNVEQALVRTYFKLLARFLVHVRRTQHRVFVLHRGKRDRSCDPRPSAPGCVDYLARGLVQDAIVVRFEPDSNSLFTVHVSLANPSRPTGRKELAASCRPHCYVARTFVSAGISATRAGMPAPQHY